MFSACGIAASSLTSQVFIPGSYTWTAPGTTNRIETISGMGGPGQPATSEYNTAYRMDVTTYNKLATTGQTTSTPNGSTYYGGTKPADYCDSPVTLSNGNQTWNCYHFIDASYWSTTPATTGPSTTAFGKIFPGGTGVPGTSTTFTLLPVNAGSNYTLTVLTGGTLTIRYYK